jgi:hypothetical protein
LSQGLQPPEVIANKDRTPLDNATIKAQLRPSPTIKRNNTGAGGRETGRAPACNREERDIWTTLFSLALAAAACFGVAAIAPAYSKYLAQLSG